MTLWRGGEKTWERKGGVKGKRVEISPWLFSDASLAESSKSTYIRTYIRTYILQGVPLLCHASYSPKGPPCSPPTGQTGCTALLTGHLQKAVDLAPLPNRNLEKQRSVQMVAKCASLMGWNMVKVVCASLTNDGVKVVCVHHLRMMGWNMVKVVSSCGIL